MVIQFTKNTDDTIHLQEASTGESTGTDGLPDSASLVMHEQNFDLLGST